MFKFFILILSFLVAYDAFGCTCYLVLSAACFASTQFTTWKNLRQWNFLTSASPVPLHFFIPFSKAFSINFMNQFAASYSISLVKFTVFLTRKEEQVMVSCSHRLISYDYGLLLSADSELYFFSQTRVSPDQQSRAEFRQILKKIHPQICSHQLMKQVAQWKRFNSQFEISVSEIR